MCKIIRADVVHPGTYILRFIDQKYLASKERKNKQKIDLDFDKKIRGMVVNSKGIYSNKSKPILNSHQNLNLLGSQNNQL